MGDDNEFGEFSSVSEGWGELNHVTTSFNPDWLAYSDNQNWASGIIPNNEHSWNASFPELPKELSNLLTDDVTGLGDCDTLPSTITNLTNVSGDEFGDFECSLSNPEVVMTTDQPITDINAPISTEASNINSSLTAQSTGGFTEDMNLSVGEDDEFGDFEGPSIPKQPDTIQTVNISELQDEAEDEFGGFVSTTAEVKEKITSDDDFGSFETAEFVTASSFPPLQSAQPTVSTVVAPPTNFIATPTNKPPPTFSTVAESCFHCDQTGLPTFSIDQSLNALAEQSRYSILL